LHWISRLHLLTGIGSYITAPLWLAFLLCGILIAVQARFVPPDYFPAGKSLFPQWPVIDPVRAMWVFIATMALLLVPKLLGAIVVLLHARERIGCGGILRLILSLLLETLIAGLLAPVVMLTQSIDVAAILLGRDSGWNAQRRDDGSLPIRDVVRAYRRHTLLGLLLGGVAWAVSPSLALWMLPVVLGLALAVPLALLTGRRGAGLALRRLGLLRIPEEHTPPPELLRTLALQRDLAALPEIGVATLLRDPALLAAHRAMLPPPRRKRLDPIDVPLLIGMAKLAEGETLSETWAGLTTAERAACLGNSDALDRMQMLAAR
jgi:membrane glycosyltransferase